MAGPDMTAAFMGRRDTVYVSSVRVPEIALIVRHGGVDIMVRLTDADARRLAVELLAAASGGR